MARYETMVPAIPRGAARWMDWFFPLVSVANPTTGTNVSADNNITNRAGATDSTVLASSTGGAGATQTYQYQNGRPSFRFSAAGAGSTWKMFGGSGFVAHVRDLAGGPIINGRNPQMQAWRFQAVVAFSNNATNCGVCVGAVDSANPFVSGNRAGVRIAVDGANGLLIQARRTSGAALTLNQTIAGSDARNWNHIDLRWVSATNQANAFWRLLLNNVQVGFWDSGTSAIMPLSQDGVNRLTLNLMFGIETGGVGNLYVALPGGINVSSAYDETSLL
jgi:hypothetical protein